MGAEHDAIDMLRKIFHYNSETGEFRYKYSRGSASKGSLAGIIDTADGYRVIRVLGRQYAAHRVAFALTYNRWPQPLCDHINGDKLDNRIVNLREATHTDNLCNSRTPKSNKSGYKGVHWHKRDKRWRARVKLNRKEYVCGHFKTVEEAAQAVAKKRQELHGEFARD